MRGMGAQWRPRLAAAVLGLATAACAGPEVTVPVYVSPNAYVNDDCDQLLDRLETVEAQHRAEIRAMKPQAVQRGRTDAELEAVMEPRSRAELDALREAALKRKCERPGRPLLAPKSGS